MIFLETERLRLRALRPDDLSALAAYRRDPACYRYQRGQHNSDAKPAELIAANASPSLHSPGCCQLGIAWKSSDELCGDVFVNIAPPTITLGYTVSPKYQRQGCACELLHALVPFLCRQWPECEIVCLVEPENTPSIGLLEKPGFVRECYAEQLISFIYVFLPGGDADAIQPQ